VSTESVTAAATDKRAADQFLAGWIGLMVCGLVAAIIWFFGIRAILDDDGVQTSALECAPAYGVSDPADCIQP